MGTLWHSLIIWIVLPLPKNILECWPPEPYNVTLFWNSVPIRRGDRHTHKKNSMWQQRQRWQKCIHSQWMSRIAHNPRSQEEDMELTVPWRLQRKHSPTDTLILNFQPPELWESKFLSFFVSWMPQVSCCAVLSHFIATPWTAAPAPLALGFSWQEYRSGFLIQGSNPRLLRLLYWQAGSLPLAPRGKACPRS